MVILIDLGFCAAMEDQHAVFVGVFMEECTTTHRDLKVPYDKVRGAIFGTDQDMFKDSLNLMKVDLFWPYVFPCIIFCRRIACKAVNNGHLGPPCFVINVGINYNTNHIRQSYPEMLL